MAKQLNIQLQVDANTQAAKKNLENLFESLNKISNLQPAFGMKMSTDLQKASKSAQDLENHLSNAMDVKTGNINLDKLETSLNKTGQKLSSLMIDLTKAGPTGEKSFIQIARAVSSAGTKLTKTQGLLSQFLTTLKNTARWQISSSILHSFMGALQGSLGYAESLNKSLNNIRIVTGQSTDQMAKFAEEANKSAKALSTSTTAYTDAALIYYQQGLSDKEVKQRTDTTVKLANISRQSAEEVSSQMTAIWNNFAKGSENLEKYADVITALGATTASSSDEIAEGLSKFASVADTVGLSYDKAAASVATVVAETRQSADVVGTAFKTIFARIEGLQLGKTLEDGVDLNKYSKALKTVGVDILDANKNIKNMDTILDELSVKWNNISDAQKIALSETVAGTRQYTQLMALMNNYDKVQKNQQIAETSEGTIEEQAQTYAESWEGAQKRVKASLESLYNELIPSDLIIKMTNGFSDVLNVISQLVKTFGGLPSILLLASSILTTKFAPEITQGLDLGIQKIQTFGTKAKEAFSQFKLGNLKETFSRGYHIGQRDKQSDQFVNLGNKIIDSDAKDQEPIYKDNFQGKNKQQDEIAKAIFEKQKDLNSQQNIEIQNLSKINNLSSLIAQNKKLMTQEQQDMLGKEVDHLHVLSEEQEKQEQILDALKQKSQYIISDETERLYETDKVNTRDFGTHSAVVDINTENTVSKRRQQQTKEDITSLLDKKTYGEVRAGFNNKTTSIATIGGNQDTAAQAFEEAQQASLESYEKIYQIREKIKTISQDENVTMKEKEDKIKEILKTELGINKNGTSTNKVYKEQNGFIQNITKSIMSSTQQHKTGKKYIEDINKALNDQTARTRGVALATGNTNKALQSIRDNNQQIVEQENQAEQAAKKFQNALEGIRKKIESIGNQKLSITANLTQAVQGFSSVAMAISSVTSAWKTLTSEDANWVDKLSSGAMALSTGIAGVSGAIKVWNGLLGVSQGLVTKFSSKINANTLAMQLNNAKDKESVAQDIAKQLSTKGLIKAEEEETVKKRLLNAVEEEGNEVTGKTIIAKLNDTGVTEAQGDAEVGATAKTYGHIAAINLEKIAILGLIAVIGLLIAGFVALSNIEWESSETTLKDLQDASKGLSSSLDEAKTKANTLRESFEKYKTATETLRSCTQGTEEWNKALSNVQETVRDLIAKYPELISKVTVLNNGTMGFTEEAMKEIQDAYDSRVEVLSNASIMGQVQVKRFQEQQTANNVATNDVGFVDSQFHDPNANYQKQEIINNAERFAAAKDVEEFKQKVEAAFSQTGGVKLANKDDDKMWNQLFDYIQSLTGIASQAEQDIDKAVTIIAENNTENKYGGKDSTTKKILSNVGEKAYIESYDEAYNDLKKNAPKSKDKIEDKDSIFNQWLKAKGYEGQGYFIANKDEDVTSKGVKYVDPSSGESKEISFEQLYQETAASKAQEDMNAAQKKASEDISKMGTQGYNFASKLDYNSGTKTYDSSIAFKNFTQDQIEKFFGGNNNLFNNLSEEKNWKTAIRTDPDGKYSKILETMGMSAEQFVNMVDTTGISIKDLGAGIDKAKKDVENSAKGASDASKFTNDSTKMTLKEQEALATEEKNAKDKVKEAIPMGSSYDPATGQYIEGSSSLIESIGKENKGTKNDYKNLTSFYKGLENIDLKSADAAEKVSNLAKKYNISGNSVNNFIDSLQNMDHSFDASTKDVESTTSKLSAIIKDSTKIGDIFTKTNIKDLQSAGINTDVYFQKLKDGTYKLTKNAEELKQAVDDISTNKLKTAIENIQKNKEEQSKQHGVNLSLFTNREKKQKVDDTSSATGKNDAYARLDFVSSFSNQEIFSKIDGASNLIDNFNKGLIQAKDLKEEQAKTISKMIDAVDKYEDSIQEEIFSTAKTVSELQGQADYLKETSGSFDYDAYSSSLITLASSYENTTQEIEDYQEALRSGDVATVEAAEDALTAATLIGEAAAKYDIDANDTETQANLIAVAYKNANDGAELSATSAARLAIANQRLNNGVKTLKENWETWSKTLKTSNHTTKDYAETLNDANEALANLVGAVDGASIPVTFLDNSTAEGAQHLEWMTDAAKGNTTAINKLGVAVAQAQVKELKFSKAIKEAQEAAKKSDNIEPTMSALDKAVELSEATFNKAKTIFNSFIDEFSTAVANGVSTAQSYLDGCGTDWIDALNEMALATGMSVEEMNSYLNELGVDVEVNSTEVKQKTKVPQYTTVEDKEWKDGPEKGQRQRGSYTYVSGYQEVEETIQVAQINTEKNAGKTPKITYTGTSGSNSSYGGVSSSSTKSSSSSNNKTSAASQSNTVHRYSQESAAVNDLTKEYSRLNKAKDSAFGASKIQAMEQELAKLKQLKQASQNYLDSVVGSGNGKNIATAVYNGQSLGKMIRNGQVGGYTGADYNSLYGGINASGTNMTYVTTDSDGNSYNTSGNFSLSALNARFGTNLQYQFDSNGNIANKDSLLNALQALKNSEENRYSSISDPTGEQKTYHSQSLAYLSEMESRLNQYTSTLSTLQEQVDSYLDNIANIQAKNAEIISTKLSNGINLSSNTISKLNRAVTVLGDKIYKNAEDMKKFFSSGEQSLNEYEAQSKVNEQALNEAIEKYNLYVNGKNGKLNENAITPAEAAAIAKEIADNYDTLISNTKAKITELQEQYSNTLDYWTNKMNDVNSSVEKTISSLTHLQNVLNLIGQSTSYEKIDKVLRGKLTATTDDYKSKKRQSDEAEKAYNKATKDYKDILAKPENKNMSDEAKDALYNSIVKKAKDDYQTKLAETEKVLEGMSEISNSIFENSLNAAYAKYENAITGKYGSFNELENSMKRQSSIAEQYLTKTNQLYETNTMLRKLSQDIDKTDSQIAKQKLKAFSDEIQSMQTQEKLSKTDLDIAKARYEVLKAQIALEEAQNAKSTVRLRRDSEGNYGYVYTADQDKISDAEQNLADKENALYNLALSNAQNYTEKMIQLEKEYVEAEKQLYKDRADGLITNDGELKRLLGELQKQYQELGLAYSESYIASNTVLNEVGAQGETEAWTNAYNDILDNLSLFNNNSEDASQEHNSKILKMTNDLDNSLKDAWAELEESRRYYQAEAEVGNAQLEETVKSLTNSVKDQTNEVTKKGGLADSYKKATSESGKYMNKLAELYKKQEDLIESFKNAADRANNFYNKVSTLKEETNNLAAAQERYNTALSQTSYYTGGNSGSGSGGSGSSGSGGSGSSGNGGSGSRKAIGPNKRWHIVTKNSDGTATLDSVDGYTIRVKSNNLHLYGLQNYKTGGYTGTWPASGKTGLYTGSWNGPDIEENGKLAFLHQKELVLNAQDTENMLNAVKLIRQISQTIDLQAMSQSSDVLMRSTPFAGERQTLQQDVVIHAEFPNATNHSEIEEAFENLVNRASQYANRSF